MTTDEILEFKIKLKRRGMSIKEFAILNGFKPYIFYPTLNGALPMRDEYHDAIRKLMRGNK